ncbi:MAG: immunoglobulin domain-containing protein [Verrucomicrobiota bacterium]
MKSTTLKLLLSGALLAGGGLAFGQPFGQWDFNAGDLSPRVGTNSLSYVDGPGGPTQAGTQFGSTAALGIPAINGTDANVMRFPAADSSMGYFLVNPSIPNGGGSIVNSYTFVIDLLFPTDMDSHVRPLVMSDEGIFTPNADLVVDSNNGIGVPAGPYAGHISPNTWYRIAFSVDWTEVHEYINGVEVGVQQNDTGLDGQLALGVAGVMGSSGLSQLFANSTLDGAAPGYVSSIQLWDVPLNAGQIAALGAASASKIPTNITFIPSYLVLRSPAVNATGVSPQPTVTAVVNPGSTMVDSNSFSLSLDGVPMSPTVTFDNTNFTVTGTAASFLSPLSVHIASLVFSDNEVGLKTNTWSFTVAQYQNITLPAPIYLETFDQVAEGAIPAGWLATNWTDTVTSGLNLSDTQSDSYKDWVLIEKSRYAAVYPDTATYTSPGFPTISGNRRLILPPIVENGVLLTSLASNNLIAAESDQRDGSQVQVLFTKDYDFAGQTNVYVSFHHINEQNQDNICAIEYSIDHGATWQPLLYMLDDGTTDREGSDVVTNQFSGQIDVFATFNTARNDQAHRKSYGTWIGAVISTNLIPYVRGCRNDDPVQQKRIELFRLPLADGQPAVRMRFLQAGTGSWYFGIDNLGFYSIDRPVIPQQPAPVQADYNGPATFTVIAGGSQLTYQWQHDGVDIPGATAASYTIDHTSTNSLGFYRVAVTNDYGYAISDEAPLSLVFTPVVVSAPKEQTVTVDAPSSFSITARGGQPLYYQWLFNSNAIPGATGTTYNINSAQTNQAGYYQVQISNAFSTVVSPAAKLTVFAGSITQDMVVHLTFDNTYADASGRGNNATNVNTPSFTNGFLGQAIRVNNNGTPANAPSINNYVTLNYPNDLKFGSDLTGDAVDFSVSFWTKIFDQNDDQSFIGNKNWDSGGNPGWIVCSEGDGMKWNYRDNAINNVPGVGSSRRDSPHLGPDMEDGGWHHVLVTFARHSVAKTYIDGVVRDTSALGIDSPTNIVGSADTDGIGFSVSIGQDGTGRYTDGGSVSHIDCLIDDLAIWRRVVTDREAMGIFNAGLRTNTVDQASTSTPGSLPAITVQPVDQTVDAGVSTYLYVSVLGTPSLAYQWYFGVTPMADATNSTLLISSPAVPNQGNYRVVITNIYGAVTSAVATLTVNAAPNITGQSSSQTVLAGNSANLAVTASGATPLAYQWYKDTTLLSGKTDSALFFASAQGADSGSYKVVVTNSLGSATSSVAVLTVITTPVFTQQPTPKFVSPGATNVDFSVAVNAPGALSYQWLKNGYTLSGATTNPLVLPVVSAADDADYSVQVSNSYGPATSTNAHLTVFTGSLGQNIVAYLPFDGDFGDYSGRRNHGTPMGSPTFGTGRVGQSLHFKTTADGLTRNYVSLGYPSDLKFGTGNFSVALWVNYTSQVDDPALISNKDWGSSSNIGWGLFAQNGGNFRISCTGTPRGSGNRFNATPIQVVRDGSWHQLVCTFWRGQGVSTYLDGVLINTGALTIAGSVDTGSQGYALNIGQDGTGNYTDGGSAAIEGDIDEVILWNRLITAQEIAQLYNAGAHGVSPLPFITSVVPAGDGVVLSWKGGLAPFVIQSKPNLTADWAAIATTNGFSATLPVGAATRLFRVVGQTQ